MNEKPFRVTESKNSRMKEFYKWEVNDEDNDERHIIHEWSQDRIKKMHGLQRSYMSFLVYSFNLSTLKSFIENFNFMVVLQMVIAAGAVWLFDKYDIYFNFHISLFVSPIVFPLAFSINTDFQRREKVLDDLANCKSAAMVLFFCMREWREGAGLDETWLKDIKQKINSMMFNLREYLLTSKTKRRDIIARIMYEDFSDLSQLIEKVRASKLPANPAIVSKSVHLLRMFTLSFERLRVIREYRSPRSIRSFNKVLILFLPIILCPYFVYLGRLSTKEINIGKWGPYYIAILTATVFGALQGVQDKLDDPFDGMSEDDINLDTIDEWTFNSLHSAAERNIYTIGRFHVNPSVEQTDKLRSTSIVQMLHNLEVTSQSFLPESHPYADVLENMPGVTRFERNTMRKSVQQVSQDIQPTQSVELGEIKQKSIAETSLDTLNRKLSNAVLEKHKIESVSFLPELQLYTCDLPSPNCLQKVSDSRLHLLKTFEEETVQKNGNFFAKSSLTTNGNRFHLTLVESEIEGRGGGLSEVVVVKKEKGKKIMPSRNELEND